MKSFIFSVLLASVVALTSCSITKLTTYSVGYQSVRTRHAQPTPATPIPNDAKIAVAYSISTYGELTVIVYNRTDEIMTIDQTMSFFVNSDGKSTCYYDPTVRTTSMTDMSSKTKGGSVNLGAIAGAIGIGGIVGQIADGINVGGSGTSGQSVTNATYVADMPRVSLAPKSNGAMSKIFQVYGLMASDFEQKNTVLPVLDEQSSYCRFSVCISYSTDGGNTFEKLVTNFYADSKVEVPVEGHGMVNDVLRRIYQIKPDALSEPWWILRIDDNMLENKNRSINRGILYDYQ